MEKVLKSRAKVRFQDCDPFNHLNNARYIDYFLKVEMKMWGDDKKDLKAIYWATYVYIDVTKKKKTEHSKELDKLMSCILNPIEERSFEERSKAIIERLKIAKEVAD